MRRPSGQVLVSGWSGCPVDEMSPTPHFPIKAIASAYALTPREMSVVTAIVDCGGVPEVAARLGLTPNTIKTHLKGIYAKTGVTRQADLVKLVASYLSPVGTPPAAPQI